MVTEAKNKKGTWFSFLMVYLTAIVVAILARVGMVIMGNMGLLGFNYKSASAPAVSESPLLDKIVGALTGGSLVGFMFTAGLVLALAVVAALLFGYRDAGNVSGRIDVGGAVLIGIITAVVSIICLVIAIGGLFSAVQTSSMSSMMKVTGGLVGVALLFIIAIGTLIAAAGCVVSMCLRRADDSRRIAVRMFIAAVICGIVVCVLTVLTYAPLAATTLSDGAFMGRLAIDIVVNLVIIFVARSIGAKDADRVQVTADKPKVA